MTKYRTVKNTIQATEVRSEHIITCRGSLEWKQSLQVAKKQCNWHQIGKVLLVRLSLHSLICNCSAKALEELAALWQTSVSSVFDTLAPESVSLAVQIFKRCKPFIFPWPLQGILNRASRHPIWLGTIWKCSATPFVEKCCQRKWHKRSKSVWMTDVSILCKTVLVKSHVKLLTARHKLYPQDQSLNGYGMKHAALPTRECCRIMCYTYNIRLCMNLNCGIGIWSLSIYVYIYIEYRFAGWGYIDYTSRFAQQKDRKSVV